MVTNSFKCTDIWALLGDVSAIHSLILSNQSGIDMEFYIDPTAFLPSDDLSGHRLTGSEQFYGYFPAAGFIFVRNWFKALNKNAYGVVSLETFSWFDLSLPRLEGFLTSGSTGFDFETDTDQPFVVTQNGISNTYLGGGSTAIPVTGLNDASEITIRLTGANTYFKLRSDNWLSLDLSVIGSITTLQLTFAYLHSLTTFKCDADTSKVTNFKQAWFECRGLTSFPLIDVSNGVDFTYAWKDCNSLITFPAFSFPKGENFSYTWLQCTSLTSFEPVNFPEATTFFQAWWECASLTSFPLILIPKAIILTYAWAECDSLTSFPAIDFSPVYDFNRTWYRSLNIVCFEGPLDFTNLSNGSNAFQGSGVDTLPLLQPPATGTAVRSTNNATAGTWTNPGACP